MIISIIERDNTPLDYFESGLISILFKTQKIQKNLVNIVMRYAFIFLVLVSSVITALSQEHAKASSAQLPNQSLKTELEAIYDSDQKIRKQLDDPANTANSMDLIHKMETDDAENLRKIKAILDRHGWLGPDQVGSKASEAIFLVIQHADIETQEKYLPMMRIAVKEKKARGSSLAMLEDRVRMRRGKKQIYGTQLKTNPQSHKYELSPLEDPKNVDKRRAEVGLGPLADYLKKWGISLEGNDKQ
jgi:hypothetical protein